MTIRSIVVRAAVAVTVSIALILVGCGGGPKLVPVAGIVTLDGQPLEGAEIAFVPVASEGEATSGSDRTGPNGNFQMTFKGRRGLAPGKYRVLVSKTEEIAPPSGVEVSEVFAKASFEKQLMGLTKETIPPQNFDHEVEVPDEGATDFQIDFKSSSKSK
ncbi:carboxypeptidase-like regulatory domain-containing protein [Tautonia rosea]|uniref:carboxypeptidase-like regulatory domain-containing protein n=1 Tax=Tautonia rosea TaxID=2728037 RepID=UPI0014767AB0|nr:carboxypeptidase-like regulatory domain-containing protein [Tautonia rosea]